MTIAELNELVDGLIDRDQLNAWLEQMPIDFAKLADLEPIEQDTAARLLMVAISASIEISTYFKAVLHGAEKQRVTEKVCDG